MTRFLVGVAIAASLVVMSLGRGIAACPDVTTYEAAMAEAQRARAPERREWESARQCYERAAEIKGTQPPELQYELGLLELEEHGGERTPAGDVYFHNALMSAPHEPRYLVHSALMLLDHPNKDEGLKLRELQRAVDLLRKPALRRIAPYADALVLAHRALAQRAWDEAATQLVTLAEALDGLTTKVAEPRPLKAASTTALAMRAAVIAWQLDEKRARTADIADSQWEAAWSTIGKVLSRDATNFLARFVAGFLLTMTKAQDPSVPLELRIGDEAQRLFADARTDPWQTPLLGPVLDAGTATDLLRARAADLQGLVNDQLKLMHLADWEPPKVTLVGWTEAPPENAAPAAPPSLATTREEVVLLIDASDNQAVREVTVQLDGKDVEIIRPEPGTDPRRVVRPVTVRLPQPGNFVLTATAVDARGWPSRPATIMVSRKPLAVKRFVHLVGIEDYSSLGEGRSLKKLLDLDVKPLEEFFGNGRPRGLVTQHPNVGGQKLENIFRGAVEEAGADAELIIYFSGHGDRRDYQGQKQSCLLAADGACKFINDLLAAFKNAPTRVITVILDACQSGTPPNLPAGTDGQLRFVVASAPGNERSDFDAQGSLFTRSLLSALKGQRPEGVIPNPNPPPLESGGITLSGAFKLARDAVFGLSSKEPYWWGSSGDDYVVAWRPDPEIASIQLDRLRRAQSPELTVETIDRLQTILRTGEQSPLRTIAVGLLSDLDKKVIPWLTVARVLTKVVPYLSTETSR